MAETTTSEAPQQTVHEVAVTIRRELEELQLRTEALCDKMTDAWINDCTCTSIASFRAGVVTNALEHARASLRDAEGSRVVLANLMWR